MFRIFKPGPSGIEYCYYVASSEPLSTAQMEMLRSIVADSFDAEAVFIETSFNWVDVVEVGPRLSFTTAFSTNLAAVCHACGINTIIRIERSRRYRIPLGVERESYVSGLFDRMTECVYVNPLGTFEIAHEVAAVFSIPLREQGPDALLSIPGLAMSSEERLFYWKYFVEVEGRDPTIVEMLDLNNANSEHSRHGFFKGVQIIDGEEMPESLMEIVQSTLAAIPGGGDSVIAFRDNSSAIAGYVVRSSVPRWPGAPAPFVERRIRYHIIFTAETHNFPTGIAPFPGAETGTGGRIRDVQATGRGGLPIAGTVGYCVAALRLPGKWSTWENPREAFPETVANPLAIEIGASDGASDYGNKFGEPVIAGFTRSFDMRLPDGERRAWIKPIMFSGGIGAMRSRHTEKVEPYEGMAIVQIGGPAYGIGVGGGSASSLMQGENNSGLDFNAVQRGDAEMEQKMNRVVRACIELGSLNPILSIHDQGAGGPANVLKELVEKSGGRIELRRIVLGDATLSVVKIWIAEYQERNAILIQPWRLGTLQSICKREKVNCELLGCVTGDGRFVVHDRSDGSTPVDLDLRRVLGSFPQRRFYDSRRAKRFKPFVLPDHVCFESALRHVLSNLAVCSKGFLVHKVDRSVTGLVARQQCCGPLQLPLADVAVVALSHSGFSGAATAIGEQPIKMLIDPCAGARMAVAEALTNLVWARIRSLDEVRCSANWMCAPKLPGEGADLYDAAVAMRDMMQMIGIAVDGGKDSLSMATRVGEEMVKSPPQLVISAYAAVPDVRKVLTPDIKKSGSSVLVLLEIGARRDRLGGSVLAQVYGQVGDVSPDVDNPAMLAAAFRVVQEMIDSGDILAGHDISDGGLIVAVLEMAFAGNCGLEIRMPERCSPYRTFFSEELGLVVECESGREQAVIEKCGESGVQAFVIAETSDTDRVTVEYGDNIIFVGRASDLRRQWEETSYALEGYQRTAECVAAERENAVDAQNMTYEVSFEPKPTKRRKRDPIVRVAILREEGSNGDREMASAFLAAGMEAWDVTMTDLLSGQVDLKRFRGMVAVGGFSYADVPGSAKGWASVIRFNERLKTMFAEFFERPDTFSLGVCNGCQLFAYLGVVPWGGIPDGSQPLFRGNRSGRFESRWTMVRIEQSPSIMFAGMEGSVLGVPVAHGEGRLVFPDDAILVRVRADKLVPMTYSDRGHQVADGDRASSYPFNPNGSTLGIAGLCTPDGRHLAVMPHPERAFLKWQWPWLPAQLEKEWKVSPWLRMFQNARQWCLKS